MLSSFVSWSTCVRDFIRLPRTTFQSSFIVLCYFAVFIFIHFCSMVSFCGFGLHFLLSGVSAWKPRAFSETLLHFQCKHLTPHAFPQTQSELRAVASRATPSLSSDSQLFPCDFLSDPRDLDVRCLLLRYLRVSPVTFLVLISSLAPFGQRTRLVEFQFDIYIFEYFFMFQNWSILLNTPAVLNRVLCCCCIWEPQRRQRGCLVGRGRPDSVFSLGSSPLSLRSFPTEKGSGHPQMVGNTYNCGCFCFFF